MKTKEQVYAEVWDNGLFLSVKDFAFEVMAAYAKLMVLECKHIVHDQRIIGYPEFIEPQIDKLLSKIENEAKVL